jgi:hypothetical protein
LPFITDFQQSSRHSQRGSKKKSNTEEIIASIRNENKRLKDLNVALIDLYTCNVTNKPYNEPIAAATSNLGNISTLEQTDFMVNNFTTYLSPLNSTPSSVPPTFEDRHNPIQYLESTHNDAYYSDVSMVGDNSVLGLTRDNSIASSQYTSTGSMTPPTLFPHTPSNTSTSLMNLTPSIPSRTNSLAPSPHATLPLPTTFAHLESSFSRRLIRSAYEGGYYMLTNINQFSPAIILRIFGFCFLHNTVPLTIQKLARGLGFGDGGHLLVNSLRWGLWPDRRDTEDGYLELGDVEWCLVDRGFSLTPETREDGREYLVKRNMRGSGSGSGAMVSGKARPVPYGTVCDAENLNEWLAGNDLTMQATGSMLHQNEETSMRLQNQASSCRVESPLPNSSDSADKGTSYIDLENFFQTLGGRYICLGRAAGFRIPDLEEVFDQCIVVEA